MDPQAATTDPNLLEREAEVDALDRALAGAVEGRGSVVAIEGPPGIGKSSLVRACLDLAEKRDMYTISVRATELERSYPYGIVRQTADSVALDKSEEERAALFTGAAKLALPILEPGTAEEGDSPELMYQRLHGLYWVIANLARDRPLLISVDDAQWADEASMAAERFLSLRIADLPMVLSPRVYGVGGTPYAPPEGGCLHKQWTRNPQRRNRPIRACSSATPSWRRWTPRWRRQWPAAAASWRSRDRQASASRGS